MIAVNTASGSSDKKFARILTLGRLTMSQVDTFATEEYLFPYDPDKNLVPMIHKVEFDYGFGEADIPPADQYFEIFIELATAEQTQCHLLDHKDIVFSHALVMWQGTAEYEYNLDHHGLRSQKFDPPIALPFESVWLGMDTVEAAQVKFGILRIFYTLEVLTDAEIAEAIAQYTED